MNIKDKLAETWAAACKHDGIPADSKFVVLSDDNPFKAEHDKWMRFFLAGERLKQLKDELVNG